MPTEVGTPNWLIIGLGNPGDAYERTRHNLGFMLVDELSLAGGGEPVVGENHRRLVTQGQRERERALADRHRRRSARGREVIAHTGAVVDHGVDVGLRVGVLGELVLSNDVDRRRVPLGIGPVDVEVPVAVHIVQQSLDVRGAHRRAVGEVPRHQPVGSLDIGLGLLGGREREQEKGRCQNRGQCGLSHYRLLAIDPSSPTGGERTTVGRTRSGVKAECSDLMGRRYPPSARIATFLKTRACGLWTNSHAIACTGSGTSASEPLSPAGDRVATMVSSGRSRNRSSTDTRWTQDTVQKGAHDLLVRSSRSRSSSP